MYTVYISNYDRVDGTRLLVTIKLCQPIRREKAVKHDMNNIAYTLFYHVLHEISNSRLIK